MKLSLFDLHCDTAGEMLRQKQHFERNTLAVSLANASVFERYVQVMAHWTDYRLDDEAGWSSFEAMLQNLKNDPAVTSGKANICTRCPAPDHSPTLLLSVEDVRIVAGRLERIDRLWEYGVRILTPLWAGHTCIGGSHDTDRGLTDFGRAALDRAVALGMILDVSHASVASTSEILEISARHARPVIASHSNAFSVCPVSRNLRDEQIKKIVASDGLIGINLYQGFLKNDRPATAADALAHIDHFLELGAENRLALGCDMDGCTLPPDVPDLASLPRLASLMLEHGYSEELIRKIFYQNAFAFAQKYL